MTRQRISLFLGAITVLVIPSAVAADPPWLARGRHGMVASDSAYASRAGVEILKAGGNAIDAAVAVSFAVGVTRPYSTGLGGGGFMIVRFADGRVVVLDYRETAPAAATADMFVKARAAAPEAANPSCYGHLAVAVPSLLVGLNHALAEHGTLPLGRVVEPAVRLAKSGYAVDEHYVNATRTVLAVYERYPRLKQTCPYVYRTHLRGGNLRAVGEKLVQPELGRLLEGIAQHGPDFFYRGLVAQVLTREMAKHGGLIAETDLAEYQVRRREPILSTYRDYELIAMPPPSSGGIALAETLNVLETIDLPNVARCDPLLAMHYQIEALKHSFVDRARWLGDADFVSVPVARLISKTYARELARRIKADASAETAEFGSEALPDDAGTSHFCVVDRFGNVVVATETINTSFGSLAAIDEWGLILNNEMDDFVAELGKPNAYGLIQSANNAIGPGKRPLSSMSPTIVLKDGAPYLMLGASGGPRIISSVLNVLLGVTDYSRSLDQAMLALRPHHQWQPDLVYFDADPSREVWKYLAQFGHKVASQRKTGIVQAIIRTDEGWLGTSDPRKGGQPAGY